MIETAIQQSAEKQAAGDFLGAKAIIEQRLQQAPTNLELLDRLAFVNIRLGLLGEAKEALITAINATTEVPPVLYAHLADVYRRLHAYVEAKSYYEKSLALSPNDADTLNGYGLSYYQQQQYQKAETCFISALKQNTERTDIMYNLALSFKAQQNLAEATACLLAILEVDLAHLRARFLLSTLLLEKGFIEEAEQHFQQLATLFPDDLNLLENIVRLLLERDFFTKAKFYAKKYIERAPNHLDMRYNLGVIASRENHPEEAVSHYRSALAIYPQHFPSLNNLGVLYLQQNDFESAKVYLNRAIQQQPDNIALRYTLNAISGEVSYQEAPQEYIRNLFDHYADHFEAHLCGGLEYCVPDRLKVLAESCFPEAQKAWSIVDLGCGTGLCGKYFRGWAKCLVGVDLSPRMLSVAKQKSIYDELILSENVEYLSRQMEAFDLIMAADVFVYQGNLQPVLEACYRALKEKGRLIFSTEAHEQENFAMKSTGRFSHSRHYIEKLCQQIEFKLLVCSANSTRLQRESPVEGYFFILQK